ncbi:hypothetical protein SEA_LEWANDO_38 [Arthrobacter phage Lewando]|nr:hypothetical protein SEA_LEWANDO_38 [Arthrobacter phage Lewando]
MIKETKERIKNVWIEASPYVAVTAAAAGAIVVTYAVDSNKRTKVHRDYMANMKANSNRATDAYIAAQNRKARKKSES